MTLPLTTEHTTRTDGDLLERYVNSRDDLALTELVTRHATLVRGVCQRILGNTPDADDAFQATFLVLIRSTGIRRPQSLAAWLYGVAIRIARRQRRDQIRPTRILTENSAMVTADPLTELATRHDVALFDAELARLPEKYRAPIVLHHLEGKSQREVAAELSLTEGAVDGLLKRGRNELRIRLARRGVVFGVTLAALQAAQDAVAATTSQPLIDATVQNALSLDPSLNPNFPQTPAARLAQQEITTMGFLHAGKTVGWMLLATAVFGTTAMGVGSGIGVDQMSLGVPGGITSVLEPMNSEPAPRSLMQLAAYRVEEESPADVEGETAVLEDDGDDEDSAKSAPAEESAEAEPSEEREESMAEDEEADENGEEHEEQRPQHFRKWRSSEQKILKALTAPTEVSFVDTSLRDAVDYIENLHNIKVIIDEQGISEDGLSADIQINLELAGAELRSALNLMLEQHGLDYLLKDEVLMITSRSIADRTLELRVYSLDGLLDEEDGEEHAAKWESLVREAAGGLWKEDNDDDAAGTVRLVYNRLVVRQNQRVHREIENLLEQLRRAAE